MANCTHIMSRLQQTPPSTMIEPELFEEQTETEEEAYEPQHPTLAFHAQLQTQEKPDHLENYVEVDPYEGKE